MVDILVKEWSASGSSPVGYRNLNNHASLVAVRHSGTLEFEAGVNTTSSSNIDLGTLYRGDGVENSDMKIITINFTNFGGDETIDEVYLKFISTDFLTDTHKLLFDSNAAWIPNRTLPEDWPYQLTELKYDINRIDGSPYFYQDSDLHCSNFIYFQFQGGTDCIPGFYGGVDGGLKLQFSCRLHTASRLRY